MASEQPNQAPLTPAGTPTPPPNAGRGIPNKNAIQEALLDTASSGYKPSLPIRGFTYDYWPVYQFWFDVDDMLEHSSIFTPLMFTQAPIMVCEHEVTASDKTVQAFCQATRDRFWTNCVRPIIDASDAYGWMGGEVVYHHVGEYLALDKIKVFAPRDVAPLLLEGEMVGVQVRNGMAGEVKLWTGADKVPSKGFWHAHRPRFGYVYGQSILKPAWRDWKRLAGRDGMEETADVGAYRYSLGFTIIRYPNEGVRDEHGREIASRDVAREMGESLKAGASIELPSTRQATKGSDGDYKWDLDFKTPEIQLSELSERENQLRKRIAGSIGCPPELLEAAETGSGFSGRMIPMMAFLLSRQAHANELTDNFVERILKPLVFWNFGPKAWVQVKVKPLLETFHKLFEPQPGLTGTGGVGLGGGSGGNGTSAAVAAATPKGPNSPEKILAAIVNAKREARLSGDPHANDREIEVLKNMMGAGGGAPEGEQHITAALGWQGETTRRGGIKAVGTAEHAGRVLYGEDAQRALQGGNTPAGQPNQAGSGSTAATPTSAPAKPARKKTPANAYGVLDKLHRNRPITLDDVHGFVKHIKTMSDEDLNSVHSLLVNRLGGTESHDRAVKHLRGLAKQHMAQRGLGGPAPLPQQPSAETEATTDVASPDEMYRSKTPAKLHMDEEPAPDQPYRSKTPAKLHMDMNEEPTTPQRSRTPARLHLDDEATIPQEPTKPQRSKTPAKVHTDEPTPQAAPVKPATKKPTGDPFAEYEPTGQKIDHPPEVPTLEPVTPDAKPSSNPRPNDALDDFMQSEGTDALATKAKQAVKPVEALTPPVSTPSVTAKAPVVKPNQPVAAKPPATTPTPVSKPKPVSVHPDLAKHDAYNDAEPRFRGDLRDVHAEHVGKTAKQLHRLATKQDLDVENAKGDPTEHAYQQHKANLLWEMHGKARRDELKAKLKPVAPAAKPTAKPEPVAQPEPTPAPQPKGERRVHPHLAKMDAFTSAHPDHQDHLRDVHANNLGRSSGALLRSAHRHDRTVQEAHENNPAEAPRHQAVANLLWEMHGKARRDEQQKRLGQQQAKAKPATAPNETMPTVDPDAERRRKAADARLERFRTQEPKRIPQNKLRYVVAQNGGLNPKSIAKDFNLQEDVKEGGIQHLMRHGGKNLDEAADELVSSGHLRVPAGREADEYLLEQLRKDADHDQGVSDEHRMEHAFHQHLAQQYEQHKADFEAELEGARNGDTDESEIAQAVRGSKEDGKAEAYSALPPDAQEGEGPSDDWEPGRDDFPFGANAGDGESDAGGTGADGTGVDTSSDLFDDEEPPADDSSGDDGDNPFTPDVPGQRSYESEPREEQQEPIATDEAEVTPEAEARQESPQEVNQSSKGKPTRFKAGKQLTPEEKEEVLRSLGDRYQDVKHPKDEIKGYHRDSGDPIYGHAHAPEHFVKSDITGAKIRHYIKLPDGRIAHPSELFPNFTQSDIDRHHAIQEHERKAKELRGKDKDNRTATAKSEANDKYKQTGRKLEGSYFAQHEDGRIVRVDGNDEEDVAHYEERGFKPITKPVVAENPKPTPPTDADRAEALAQAGPTKQPNRDDEAYALDQQRREQVADSNAKESDAQVRPDDPRGRFWKDARPDDIYEGASQSVTGDRKNDEATPDVHRANAAYAAQRRANAAKPTTSPMANMTPDEAEALYQEQQAKKSSANVKAFDPVKVPVNDPSLDAPRELVKGEGGDEGDKKPWQMTREEFFNDPDLVRSHLPDGGGKGGYRVKYKYTSPSGSGPFVGEMTMLEKPRNGDVVNAAFGAAKVTSVSPAKAAKLDNMQLFQGGKIAHRKMVEGAIAAGKSVPPEVLADYPDLQPKPTRPSSYHNGDRIEYTGRTQQEKSGDITHEVEFMEGRKQGSKFFTSKAPDGNDPNTERNKRDWQDQQSGFRRLREAQEAEKKGQANANPNPQATDTPVEPSATTGETNPTPASAKAEEGKKGEVAKPKAKSNKPSWSEEEFYHGSNSKIANFEDVTGRGISFSNNPHHASNFGEHVHRVKLNVRKPIDLRHLGTGAEEEGVNSDDRTSTKDIQQALKEHGIEIDFGKKESKGWTTDLLRPHMPEIIRQAKKLGYDGMHVQDYKDFEADETVVFDPNNIKHIGIHGEEEQESDKSQNANLPPAKSPHGGMRIDHKQYPAGTEIPPDVLRKMTPQEKRYLMATTDWKPNEEEKEKPKPKRPRKPATPSTPAEHSAAHWQQAAERLRERGIHPSGKELAAEFKKVQAEAKAKLAPHELRQADYLDQHKPDWSQRTISEMRSDHKKLRNPANKAQAAANLAKAIEHGQAAHQEQVKRALAEGKTVPPHVLADYPQLGKAKEDGPAPPRAVTSDRKELADSIKQRIAAIREEEERLPTSREDEVQRTLQEKRARQQRMEKLKQKGPLDWSHFATHEEFTQMEDMNHPGWEAVDNHNAELIEANSKESDVEPRHGMTHKEPMRSIQVGHLHIHYAHDGYGVHHAAYVASLLAASPIHEGIAKHTHEIVLTGQSNKDDPYWQKEFKNPNFKAAATGQGGTVVVYNHATLGGVRGIAHEMGHNMAHKLFGSVTPHADSEFAKASKAEGPTSDYGGHNLAEDFAESVAHYHDNPTQFKRDFPKKYRILMDMLKDKEANRG